MSASQSTGASEHVAGFVQSPDVEKGVAPITPRPTKERLNPIGELTNKYRRFWRLNRAISRRRGKNDVKEALRMNPELATVEVDVNRSTPLHLACITAQMDIVDLLLPQMSDDLLARTDIDGSTALQLTAISGDIEIAKRLVERNPSLLGDKGGRAEIPVVLAAKSDNREMTYFLYDNTDLRYLLLEGGEQGAMLLNSLINPRMLDIAFDLIQSAPALCLVKPDREAIPLVMISTMPTDLFSASDMSLFKRFIYNRIKLSIREKYLMYDSRIAAAQYESLEPMHNPNDPLKRIVLYLYKISGIDKIRKLKQIHFQFGNLLHAMSLQVSRLSFEDRHNYGVHEAIFSAVRYGAAEFIREIIEWNPEMMWLKHPNTGIHLIHHAVKWRQKEVFRLLLRFSHMSKKLLSFTDNEGNNILHICGDLPHRSTLESISGAALRMQRELQWFKEVDRITPDIMKQRINSKGKTPREKFSEAHAELRQEAEKWMKGTAKSYSTAVVLVVTIMFTVAFTLPGGNEENTGYPIHIRDMQFVVFMTSDIISFFTASSSMLVFLGILTTRHAEDDYFCFLPFLMMVGLSMLFVSIVAMVTSFSSGLLTAVRQRSRIFLPIIPLATIPVVLFIRVQTPLLVEMTRSTYRSLKFTDRKT